MARPMIKEAGMASLLLENPYYILLLSFHISRHLLVYLFIYLFLCLFPLNNLVNVFHTPHIRFDLNICEASTVDVLETTQQ